MVDQHGLIFSSLQVKKSLANFDETFRENSSEDSDDVVQTVGRESRPMSPDVLSTLSGDFLNIGGT